MYINNVILGQPTINNDQYSTLKQNPIATQTNYDGSIELDEAMDTYVNEAEGAFTITFPDGRFGQINQNNSPVVMPIQVAEPSVVANPETSKVITSTTPKTTCAIKTVVLSSVCFSLASLVCVALLAVGVF